MAYAQTNSLSLIEGRVLEGEKELAYWCMPAILHSLFFHLILSSLFCHFFFLFPFFFLSYCLPMYYIMMLRFSLVVPIAPYYAWQGSFLCCLLWLAFTILAFKLPLSRSRCPCRPPLVCQLSSHHYLPVLAAPLPITRQRRLFCLLAHYGILIHPSVGALSLSLMACT